MRVSPPGMAPEGAPYGASDCGEAGFGPGSSCGNDSSGTDCPAPACPLGPHLWLSTSVQSTGLLCQRDDSARIVVLGVAPRAACTPAQVVDSLAFSAKALGVLSQDDPRITAYNAFELRLESPETRRFWTASEPR